MMGFVSMTALQRGSHPGCAFRRTKRLHRRQSYTEICCGHKRFFRAFHALQMAFLSYETSSLDKRGIFLVDSTKVPDLLAYGGYWLPIRPKRPPKARDLTPIAVTPAACTGPFGPMFRPLAPEAAKCQLFPVDLLHRTNGRGLAAARVSKAWLAFEKLALGRYSACKRRLFERLRLAQWA